MNRISVRLLAAFSLLCLAPLAFPQEAQGQDAPVEISIPDTSAAPGETVAVPIQISNLEAAAGVLSYGFEMSYDGSVLAYAGFEKEGTLSKEAGFTINDNPSVPRIGAFGASTTLNEVAEDGSGTMLRVKFTVTASDSATVTLEALQFNAGDIPADPPQPSFEIGATGENVPPVAEPDSFQTVEDSTLSVTEPSSGVLGNDTDLNGDSLSASLVTGVSNGTLSLNPDGTFNYTPNTGFFGTDSFTYEVTDGRGGSDQATATIVVQPAGNVPPVAEPDGFQTPENSPLSVPAPGVLANDSDPNGDTLSASLVSGVSNGSLTLDGDGSFEYMPDSSFTGTDSFTYAVSDGDSTDQATVTIEVQNLPPVANADSFQTTENQSLLVEAPGVLGNDTDPNGDPLTSTLVSGVSNGTLTLNEDGSFEYAPDSNFAGTDSFVYEASDEDGGTTQATATIVVRPAENVPPVAEPDSFQILEDSTLSVPPPGVLANDTDANGDTLSASLVSGVTNGSLTLNNDGSFEYTPASGFVGTDGFTYEVSDGDTTDQSTVEIDVVPENPPVEVSIPDTTAAPGDTVSVPIQLDNLEAAAGVLSYGFELSFDQSVLAYAGFEENGTLSQAADFTVNDNPDIPRIGGFGASTPLNAVAEDGSGTMIKIKLAVTAADSATVTLDALQFNAGDIPASPQQPSFVVVGVENAPPTVVTPLPDDTLLIPGPPLQLTGLQSVFSDPNGDPLMFSATSSNPDVVEVPGSSPQVVVLQPKNTGSSEISIVASDPSGLTATTTFTVVVEDRPSGEQPPAARASAAVPAGADSAAVSFGQTGVGALFRGVQSGGTVEVSFFPDSTNQSSGEVPAFVPADSFQNVSRYRWTIDNQGVTFDSADVAFALANPSVVGVGQPDTVTIVKDENGDGDFQTVSTNYVGGSTPDPTDDALIAQDQTSFSTYKFASNDSDNPLPVELASFTAQQNNGAALLRWRTASETNNAGFEVQHKGPDEKRFSRAGYVASKAQGGTSTDPTSYRFEVKDLSPGTHTFRLRQVDIDGGSHLSKTTSVTLRMKKALRLTAPAPNPVRTRAQFRFGVRKAGKATVSLYNVLGQRVATLYEGSPAPGQMQRVKLSSRQLADLPSGVYFVRLKAHGTVRTRRLVVVH